MSNFELSPTVGLVNIPISGSLLSGEFSPSLIKNNYVINVYVRLNQSHSEPYNPADKILNENIENLNDSHTDENEPPKIRNDRVSIAEKKDETDNEQPFITNEAPPCSIKTTLIFNNSKVIDYNYIDFKLFTLHLLTDGNNILKFGNYQDLVIQRIKSQAEFIAHHSWLNIEEKNEYDIPADYNTQKNFFHPPGPKQKNSSNHLKLSSQVQAHDKSVSLYELALDRTHTMIGQDICFSSELFANLYLLVFRAHKKNGIWVRYMSLLALPLTNRHENG